MASKRVRERVQNWATIVHGWYWPIEDMHVLKWTETERLDELLRRQSEADEIWAEIEAGASDRVLRQRYGSLFTRLRLP